MAGAIWGAGNGISRLDRVDIESLELANTIKQLAEELYDSHCITDIRKT